MHPKAFFSSASIDKWSSKISILLFSNKAMTDPGVRIISKKEKIFKKKIITL
jgi:hypothetical protein